MIFTSRTCIFFMQISSIDNSVIEESSQHGSKLSRNTTIPSSSNLSTHAFNVSTGELCSFVFISIPPHKSIDTLIFQGVMLETPKPSTINHLVHRNQI